ncbi:Uncharacterised protein [Xylophilus ampelinus]|nr:Uncharacterised protein [Xylophilus ampelinus]
MAKPVAEGDRLLTPAERMSVVAEANYQIEPLLYAMRRLAEEESDHLRFYCIAVLPRLQQLNHAAQSASCDECYLSELAGYDVPIAD